MNFGSLFSSMIFASVSVLSIAIFTLSSCSKDDGIIKDPVGIEGYYSGKYGFGSEVPGEDQRYRIKEGGIFQEIGLHSGAVVGEGTWVLDGHQFSAAYTITFSPFNKYSVLAVFNPSTGKLSGTWGGEHDATDGGKIDMMKE